MVPSIIHRPALVIYPKSYNKKAGLALFCPVTNQEKGYPFEVSIHDQLKISGVVLSDQIKRLDWKGRNAKYACTFPEHRFLNVQAKIATLIE